MRIDLSFIRLRIDQLVIVVVLLILLIRMDKINQRITLVIHTERIRIIRLYLNILFVIIIGRRCLSCIGLIALNLSLLQVDRYVVRAGGLDGLDTFCSFVNLIDILGQCMVRVTHDRLGKLEIAAIINTYLRFIQRRLLFQGLPLLCNILFHIGPRQFHGHSVASVCQIIFG